MSLSDDELLEHFRNQTKIAVPLFGDALVELFFKDEGELLQFADVIRNFLALSLDGRDRATPHVFAFFKDFVDEAGCDWVEEGMQGLDTNSAAIWQYVRPNVLGVLESWELGDRDQLRSYVVIEGECGWEQEHGILMSWRDGRELVKVSGYDGHATNAHAYDDLAMDAWVYHSSRPEMCSSNPLTSS